MGYLLAIVFVVLAGLLELKRRQALERERATRRVLDRISDAFLTLDREWNVTFANPAALRTMHREDVIGKNFWDLYPELVGTEVERRYREAVSCQQPASFAYQPPGTQYEFDISAYPSPEGLTIYYRDLTDAKRAEAMVRESEETLRFALEAANLVAFSWNIPTGEFRLSKKLGRTIGLGPEASVGTFDEFCRRLLPEELEWFQGRIAEALDNGAFADERREIRGNGSIRWLLDKGRVTFDDCGNPVRLFGITLDITERKLFEERLKEHAEQLERSNADLERFAYVASHDLREPLRTVINYAELLERKYSAGLDRQAREYLRFITQGTVRMHDLVGNLLEYARVGREAEPFQPIDSGEVAEEAIQALDKTIKENGARVVVEERLPEVLGNRVQLMQLFQNLISNAIKYRGDRRPEIRIGAWREKNEWRFYVRDNGIGIAAGDRERIFEMFRRLHSKEGAAGTGIGLAICKRIVSHHGGSLWVESTPGEGSTFRFTLPVAFEAFAPSPAKKRAEFPIAG